MIFLFRRLRYRSFALISLQAERAAAKAAAGDDEDDEVEEWLSEGDGDEDEHDEL